VELALCYDSSIPNAVAEVINSLLAHPRNSLFAPPEPLRVDRKMEKWVDKATVISMSGSPVMLPMASPVAKRLDAPFPDRLKIKGEQRWYVKVSNLINEA
jgi:hypothetical protein